MKQIFYIHYAVSLSHKIFEITEESDRVRLNC
jgi:hypothetical protein